MTFQEIVALLRSRDLVEHADAGDAMLATLAVDSRAVVPGALFLAFRGSVTDGHGFISAALATGAVAILAERVVEVPVPLVVVRDGRKAAQLLAEAWYGYPAEELRIAAVTGTNGKTTTTGLMRHLWNAAHDAGSIGTLGAFDGAGNTIPSSAGTLTTPGPLDLQATFRAMRAAGVTQLAMEASSHALDQGRLDALRFACGIYTQLTREHLDYHATMEHYLAAKLRLADLVAADGVLSVNADDPAWAPLLHDRRSITWGYAPSSNVRIGGVVLDAGGSRFVLSGHFGEREAAIPIAGEFNVSNAAAAATAALGLGMSLREVTERLAVAPQVPGRMEILTRTPCTVLRDYAHTPDAMERVLNTLRPLTSGRLTIVFGCGGERDRGKRPIMTGIAVALADRVVLTEDNPRGEDPEQILDDMVEGLPSGAYVRERDRELGIARALEGAKAGDTILLAGKGHETYQVIGKTYHPFDERRIVLGLTGG